MRERGGWLLCFEAIISFRFQWKNHFLDLVCDIRFPLYDCARSMSSSFVERVPFMIAARFLRHRCLRLCTGWNRPWSAHLFGDWICRATFLFVARFCFRFASADSRQLPRCSDSRAQNFPGITLSQFWSRSPPPPVLKAPIFTRLCGVCDEIFNFIFLCVWGSSLPLHFLASAASAEGNPCSRWIRRIWSPSLVLCFVGILALGQSPVLISRSRVWFPVLFAALGLDRFVRLSGVCVRESETSCSVPDSVFRSSPLDSCCSCCVQPAPLEFSSWCHPVSHLARRGACCSLLRWSTARKYHAALCEWPYPYFGSLHPAMDLSFSFLCSAQRVLSSICGLFKIMCGGVGFLCWFFSVLLHRYIFTACGFACINLYFFFDFSFSNWVLRTNNFQ
jgi:hypothetical protein